MAMAVTVEVTIPDCAFRTVTLLLNPPPAGAWRALAQTVTRTCPVSGDVHAMELDITYVPNFFDWTLDTVFIGFGTPEIGIVSFGVSLFPSLTSSLTDEVAETQTRTVSITVPPTGTALNRLQGGVFNFIVTDMPVSYLRTFQAKIAFGYSLIANNMIVVVHEDAGDGVAGDAYGSVITDAEGRFSLRYFAPLRDFVLRVPYDGDVFDCPLAAGTAELVATTSPPIDKTTNVLHLLEITGSGPGANPT